MIIHLPAPRFGYLVQRAGFVHLKYLHIKGDLNLHIYQT